jgi:hypothetical protein
LRAWGRLACPAVVLVGLSGWDLPGGPGPVDRTLFADGAQDCRAADAEMQPLLTPDPPHRSRMGMTRGPRDHPVGPSTGELLVDPRSRQGCPLARGAVQVKVLLVPSHTRQAKSPGADSVETSYPGASVRGGRRWG